MKKPATTLRTITASIKDRLIQEGDLSHVIRFNNLIDSYGPDPVEAGVQAIAYTGNDFDHWFDRVMTHIVTRNSSRLREANQQRRTRKAG